MAGIVDAGSSKPVRLRRFDQCPLKTGTVDLLLSTPRQCFSRALAMKMIIESVLSLTFLCVLAIGPKAQAVLPPPDGCYPNYTTAEGCNALSLLTTGAANTGVGWYSLFSAGGSNYNTGVGAGALALTSADGDSNTAVGTAALLLNTTGTLNTAVGNGTLVYNDTGNGNTAIGYNALPNNTTGTQNTAIGYSALRENTTGGLNTAVGLFALINNTEGGNNTAIGRNALQDNETGSANTAIGYRAGLEVTGDNNVCIGGAIGVAG